MNSLDMSTTVFFLYQEEPKNLPLVGLLAQLVEHCTGVTEVKSS